MITVTYETRKQKWSTDRSQLFLRAPTEQVSTSFHLKTEEDLISETLFSIYLEVWTMDKVQKPNDPGKLLCCRRPAAIFCSALH
jgi:hypothetical protein